MAKHGKTTGGNTSSALNSAKSAKNDEFYTQLTDIAKEMRFYRPFFRGKAVLCNCDDPYKSNFFKYFARQFNAWELKTLVATCYAGLSHKVEVTEVADDHQDGTVDLADVEYLLANHKNNLVKLKGDGDFRSEECIEYLKRADIVVTNPPFSLFREYVAQLVEYKKKFIIIGNVNSVTYKEIFPLIQADKMWLGMSIHSGDREFRVPDHYPLDAAGCRVDENGMKYIRVKGVRWFTNIDIPKRHEELVLYKKYSPKEYPKYDNYDAIEVNKVVDIPMDYDGVMGVPITFLDKYCPEQFEILGLDDHRLEYPAWRGRGPDLNGKPIYRRIMIRKR